MYYYVRNRFHTHRAKFNNKLLAYLNYCCFLVAMAGVVVVYQKTDKLKKISFIFWPAADAFRNSYSATPPMILSRLNSGASADFRNPVKNYVKNTLAILFSTPGLSGSQREVKI
jgi:hypothetical protein